MSKRQIRIKGASRDALIALGQLVRIHRISQGVTLEALAERSGVSKQTMVNIEKGVPGVAIGNVFNAAVEVGVPLFSEDEEEVARMRRRGHEMLSLMPSRVEMTVDMDDDLQAL